MKCHPAVWRNGRVAKSDNEVLSGEVGGYSPISDLSLETEPEIGE